MSLSVFTGSVQKTDVYLDFIGVLDADTVKENNTAQISETVRNMMEAFKTSTEEFRNFNFFQQ